MSYVLFPCQCLVNSITNKCFKCQYSNKQNGNDDCGDGDSYTLKRYQNTEL